MEIGFDSEKYLKVQSEKIAERIKMFDNKLYLEFGGKIFDDLHAARVLPGFKPDNKIKLLQEFKDDLEVIFCINAADIQKRSGNFCLPPRDVHAPSQDIVFLRRDLQYYTQCV